MLAISKASNDRRGGRIVALGGGTGLPALLHGLKEMMFPGRGGEWTSAERERLTAIVTMADDGGSSGRLRRDYGSLPPGDLRNCLLALADGDPRLASLFGFRFRGGELGGHNLGNLILTALTQMEDDLPGALDWAGGALRVRGRVLPATVESLTLRAVYEDGSRVNGESRIAAVRRRIHQVSVHPADAHALPEAVRAILAADLIVIGPGSLYTSILPVLLIRGIAAAIERSAAPVLFVLNIMTEPGETDGYGAADFITAIRRHVPRLSIDHVLLNDAPIPARLLQRYANGGATAIDVDAEPLRFMGCGLVFRDLLHPGGRIRHDPAKLGCAVMELAEEETRCAVPS